MKQATKNASNRSGLFISAMVGFILAYALGARAIDTGSYWQYLGCLVFLALSFRLITRVFKK